MQCGRLSEFFTTVFMKNTLFTCIIGETLYTGKRMRINSAIRVLNALSGLDNARCGWLMHYRRPARVHSPKRAARSPGSRGVASCCKLYSAVSKFQLFKVSLQNSTKSVSVREIFFSSHVSILSL